MQELEASLAALHHAVDVYVARRLGRRFPLGSAGGVRPIGVWTARAPTEATVTKLRDRTGAWLRAMADKVLRGRR